MSFRYLTVPVTAFQQNCSIVWCDATNDAALIDPGGEISRLLAEVKRLGLTLKALWLTHAHIDHAGGTGELARTLDLPIIGPHPGDQFWIAGLPQQTSAASGNSVQSTTSYNKDSGRTRTTTCYDAAGATIACPARP